MNLRKTLSFATAISLGAFGALGCGSDDPANPDAAQGADATPRPDAEIVQTCTDLTVAGQTVGADVGFEFDVGPTYLARVEFYDATAGTFDLGAGDDANYSTCVNCFRIFDITSQESTTQWFQSGGSLTLTADPTTTALAGSVTDLTLTEVTIADDGSFVSTPVVGGTCLSLGSFALLVEPPPVPANDTCAAAVTIAVPSTTAGTTLGALSDLGAGLEDIDPETACTGFAQNGGDVMYMVPLTAGTEYVFTMTPTADSPDFDGAIALLGPGDATVCTEPVACLIGADATVSGEAETFTFTPTTTGDYFVIVDSFSLSTSGDFDLDVAVGAGV